MTKYWVKVGREVHHLVATTEAAAKRDARAIANRVGRAVTLGYGALTKPAKPAKRMQRNPVMQGVDFTGESWKISYATPHGRGVAYATTEAEARDEVRLLRARGWRPTHVVRLRAPNLASAPKKRSRARKRV